jgi:dTDP-4-dehydrorhamnose reductase
MLGAMVTEVLASDPDLEVTATTRSPETLGRAQVLQPAVRWKSFDAARAEVPRGLAILEGSAWIVNAIGITKPHIDERNPTDVERAIRINCLFPHLLGAAAIRAGASVLQIATDCVYSGARGRYIESDEHDPIDVYGKTKSLGEVRFSRFHHLRCSIVGPERDGGSRYLLDWFRKQPAGAELSGYVNHRWNGVTTLHFARVARGIVKSGASPPHVHHLVPGDEVSKADLLKEFAVVFGRADLVIRETDAPRAVDRTLATIAPEINQGLWKAAGYDRAPTVGRMISELRGAPPDPHRIHE